MQALVSSGSHPYLVNKRSHTKRASSSRQNVGQDVPSKSSKEVIGQVDKVIPSQATGNVVDNAMNAEGGRIADNGWDAPNISQGWHYDALAENFFMKNS